MWGDEQLSFGAGGAYLVRGPKREDPLGGSTDKERNAKRAALALLVEREIDGGQSSPYRSSPLPFGRAPKGSIDLLGSTDKDA